MIGLLLVTFGVHDRQRPRGLPCQGSAPVDPCSAILRPRKTFLFACVRGDWGASLADRAPEQGGGTPVYWSHCTDVMFLVARSSPAFG
jgi:hypothetical protein